MYEILSTKLTVLIIKHFLSEQFVLKLARGHIRLHSDLKMVRIDFIILIKLFPNHALYFRLLNRYFHIIDCIYGHNQKPVPKNVERLFNFGIKYFGTIMQQIDSPWIDVEGENLNLLKV